MKIVQNYRIEFGYSHLLPLLDLHLIGPKNRQKVIGLVDSGATFSIFHSSIAEDAGYNLNSMPTQNIQFGGNLVITRKCKVYFMIKEKRFNCEVCFTDKMNLKFNLIGRVSFFAQFNEVSFIEKDANPRIELRY